MSYRTFIVRLISRTFGQNVSKAAIFEHSLKKLFAGMPYCVLSLKKLFSQNSIFSKNFSLKNLCLLMFWQKTFLSKSLFRDKATVAKFFERKVF